MAVMIDQKRILHTLVVLALVSMNGALPEEIGYDLSPPNASGYSYEKPESSLAAGATPTQGKSTTGGSRAFSLAAVIPGGGIPGRDFPLLASVPPTGFSCARQNFPGYYADTSSVSRCQVFHICQFDGRQDSFLCPNGTIFNQQYFVCDWWYNVDCTATGRFVNLNAEIGKVPIARSGSSSSASSSSASLSSSASPSSSALSSFSSSLPTADADGSLVASKGVGSSEQQVTKPSGLYSVPDEK